VLADCGLLNIPEIGNRISETVYTSEEAEGYSLSLMSIDRCFWQVIVQFQIRIIRSRNMRVLGFVEVQLRSLLKETASSHCVTGARSLRGSLHSQISLPPRHEDIYEE